MEYTAEDAKAENERIQALRKRIPEIRAQWTLHDFAKAKFDLEIQIADLLHEFTDKTAVPIKRVEILVGNENFIIGVEYLIDIQVDI